MKNSRGKFKKKIRENSGKRPYILLPFIIIPLLLGVWQCFRLIEKNNIITNQLTNQKRPAQIWYQNPNLTKADRGRQFEISGQLLPQTPVFLIALKPNDDNERRGYQIIMPFQSITGEVLPISLGFISENRKRAISDQQLTEQTKKLLQTWIGQKLTLIVWYDPILKKNIFAPDNILSSDIWFSISAGELAEKWQYSQLRQKNYLLKTRLVEQTIKGVKKNWTAAIVKQELGVSLVYFDRGLPLPYNRHFEYIITWWLIALGGFLLYWFGSYKKTIKIKK